uniref:Tripartite motif-containing protein 16-like n=1 Tax=Fundulus heteroclitus TaxID=8078 RepID=A0A3Q2PK22_FUNHE
MEKFCSRHEEVMKIFCRTDQQTICIFCLMDEHKDHNTVSVVAERKKRQAEFGTCQTKVKLTIQNIERDVKVLQKEMEAISHSADEAVKDSERVFTELVNLIEKKSSALKEQIRSQQKAELSLLRERQVKLEEKITELREKEAKLEQLLQTEDHVHFLQNDSLLKNISESIEFPSITNLSLAYFKDVTQAVLTLDSNTVNPWLALSEGGRKAEVMKEKQTYPNHPDRFTDCLQALSKESLIGRCYWEVERGTGGISVAVAYKAISRTGNESGFGNNNKSWTFGCFDITYYFRHDSKKHLLPGPKSSKIGVYLDHRAGTLSFYSISDTMTLLHNVQTTFTHPLLLPFLCIYWTLSIIKY